MSSVPTPELPQYRVTLFFGPQPVKATPSRVCCVFNVKKRSWKGGVQIAVELEEDQLARARQMMSVMTSRVARRTCWCKDSVRSNSTSQSKSASDRRTVVLQETHWSKSWIKRCLTRERGFNHRF